MQKNIRLWIQKYRRWEFWPGYLFDIPVYIYCTYLVIKAGHIGFFSNINPSMILSGFAGYSKYDDIDKFEPRLLPISILITEGHESEYSEQQMKENNIHYPCIAKPTLGRTGRDVKKIHNSKQLKTYLKRIHEDILIQEFIDYPLEFGIFYYRIPGEEEGHITGIVEKKFMFLHGDGKSTFEQLIYNHPRAKYYYHQFKEEYKEKWTNILADWEKFQLNYIGNHCRGSVFYDVSKIITPELEKIIDDMSKKIDGFYFGRYDIKAKSVEELCQGNFKIIELNGMGSLPTHIYDPKHTLRNAYKTLIQHRDIAYRISKENKKRGHKFVPFKEIRKIVKQYWI
ncbi:MAG: hypothetical protein ACD_80C00102G0014 [uncultured bacterium (gcode 4)]|uniref:ATP-grasp domain-containing protein n=1 Tax=uncultured bacterium (gcode 4) TaxID=1234023 RepID=K1XJ50_9BACT|nr:MAG: hypothetical protein ACD_80C00102G0014 [uncultured bacterium (gcode 4)]